MVRARPSWAAIATRRHAAGLSAASVATTAIVVLSGLFSGIDADGNCAKASICSAGGGVSANSPDQVRHPRQTGGPVDDVARGVHDDDRADGHARTAVSSRPSRRRP